MLSKITNLPLLSKSRYDSRVDTFVMIYDQQILGKTPVRFKQILARITERIRNYPRYQQRFEESKLGLSDSEWSLDEDFNTEFHVHHVGLPQPGDWRQFCILMARMHARPIDHSRPLWQINVIEGLNDVPFAGANHFALVCKIHNKLMSESEKQGLIWAVHDALSDNFVQSSPSNFSNKFDVLSPLTSLILGNSERLLRPITTPITTSWELARKSIKNAVPSLRFLSTLAFGKTYVPYTRFNTDVSSFRVWESSTISAQQIDKLKKRFETASSENLVIAIISGALREYLKDKTELANRSLKLLVPETQGNEYLNYAIMELATSIDDPIERLTKLLEYRPTSEAIGPKTSYPGHLSPFQRVSKANNILHQIQKHKSRGNPLFNTALINMGSSNEELSLFGAPMIYCSGIPEITDGLGLIHMMSTTSTGINIAFTSCREMLPDPAFYRDCISHSINELCDAADPKKT